MAPTSKLFVPPAHLASCVFAGIYRDTRGTSLPRYARINHFPASPLVIVSRVFHGELRMLGPEHDLAQVENADPLPVLSVMGPQDTPVSSWSPGTVTALSIGIFYDAWRDLGGDADFRTLPVSIAQALARYDPNADPLSEWNALTAALTPVWNAHRLGPARPLRSISDWARSAMTRAALSSTGRSVRSIERRIKRDSGQTGRALNFFSTLEDLHRRSVQDRNASLAEFAFDAGFSDQSHMGRAVRRLTGFSPAQLNRSIERDEAFWCYRLLGERY